MAMLFQPILIAGGVVGVTVNLFFPAWILMLLAVLVLLYLVLLTFKKAVDTLEIEQISKNNEAMSESINEDT